MNHYPFDDGVLAALGALAGQKTIKALCGKRVAFLIDAHTKHVDCPACREVLKQRIANAKHLMTMTPSEYVSDDLRKSCEGQIARLTEVLNR